MMGAVCGDVIGSVYCSATTTCATTRSTCLCLIPTPSVWKFGCIRARPNPKNPALGVAVAKHLQLPEQFPSGCEGLQQRCRGTGNQRQAGRRHCSCGSEVSGAQQCEPPSLADQAPRTQEGSDVECSVEEGPGHAQTTFRSCRVAGEVRIFDFQTLLSCDQPLRRNVPAGTTSIPSSVRYGFSHRQSRYFLHAGNSSANALSPRKCSGFG